MRHESARQDVHQSHSRRGRASPAGIACLLHSLKDGFFHFYEKVVKPSMYRVGELWEKNQITVADEHLATATLKYLLATLFTHQEAYEDQPKALLFCIEGEHHSLGLELANEVFKEKQWNTRYLGSNVPVKDALSFIDAWQPQVIGISIGMTTELVRLKTVSVKSGITTQTSKSWSAAGSYQTTHLISRKRVFQLSTT